MEIDCVLQLISSAGTNSLSNKYQMTYSLTSSLGDKSEKSATRNELNNCRLIKLPSGISIRKTVPVKNINVSVISSSINSAANWRNKKGLPLLEYWTKIILQQFDIIKGSTIRCSNDPIAGLCEIFAIIVLECDGVGRIDQNTALCVNRIISKESYELHSHIRTNFCPGGLEREIELLETIVNYSYLHGNSGLSYKGLLLIGPSGTGKTTLVKHVCQKCKSYLITLSAIDFCQTEKGTSEEKLRQIFAKAEMFCDEGPCVLHIDKIDILCSKRNLKNFSGTNGLLAQFLTLMDGLDKSRKVLIIGETSRPNDIDSAIRRPGRFDQEIIIGVPNYSQRVKILKSLTSSLNVSQDINFQLLADKTAGYVGADLKLLCQEAVMNNFRKNKMDHTIQIINMEDLVASLNVVKASTLKGCSWYISVNPVYWNDIGGMDEIKQRIKKNVEWPLLYPEAFNRVGLCPPKGILFYGPPGCCKTTLVRAAATSCNATFLSVSSAQIYSPFVGDSEKSIVEVFHRARLGAPSIIFFDEIDSLVGKRSFSKHHDVQEKVLSTLLNEMDGVGTKPSDLQGTKVFEGSEYFKSEKEEKEKRDNSRVLVVAATNRPDMIDEAVLRHGRFDAIIGIPPPDEQTRESILKVHTKKMPLDDVNLKEIASKTDLFSGADLQNLCREAVFDAISENGFEVSVIKMENFKRALRNLKPSLDKVQLQMYNDISKKYHQN